MAGPGPDPAAPRQRARQLGICPGVLPAGPTNSFTDVPGVQVGHLTLIEGSDIRTGATAILPHPEGVFNEKVPAGLAVGNGFGKLTGSTQIFELGELETPILLTNTLAAPRAASALIEWTLSQPGCGEARSVNPVVGETNDGYLNDIRRQSLSVEMFLQTLSQVQASPVAEGALGAGTGTMAFGWKSGIGSASRRLPDSVGGWNLGVLVQSNFGGVLQIMGAPVGQRLGQYYLKEAVERPSGPGADGSIMIVLATDAPLSDRNLTRLARRALAGLARTGAAFQNGSGDYVIAFSTHLEVRRTPSRRGALSSLLELPNDLLSPLFQAAIESTEEAIYNSLFMAESMSGYMGHHAPALPLQKSSACGMINM